MELAPLDDDTRKYSRADSGVLVRGVEAGGIAHGAGVAPGDVVVAVNGEPVDSIEAIPNLADPARDAELTLLRRGRRIAVSAQDPQSPSATDKADIGLRLEEPPAGYEVESVVADSAAGRAGIRAGDRLLEVNGVKVRRREDVDRLLKRATAGPLFMVVSRGRRQVGILLP
jgi:S1-C subfamily serine protease